MAKPKPYENIQERIRILLPGDDFKKLRHDLYSRPDFLASNPSDEMILDQIEFFLPPDKVEEVKVKVGEIVPDDLDFNGLRLEVVSLTDKKNLPALNSIGAIATPEQYQEVDKVFASLKSVKADLEAKRTKLKAPVLDLGKYIDSKFKEAQAFVDQSLAPCEALMIAFKAREREALRQQEAERQRLIQEAETQARLALEEAKANLADVEADPFLAALSDGAARESVKDAIREVATISRTVTVPDAVAPVVGAGSRVSYPWIGEVIGEVPVAYCSPDPVKINALVKHLKETVKDITQLEASEYPWLRIIEQIKLGGR